MSKLIRIDLTDSAPWHAGNDEANVESIRADVELHGLLNAIVVWPKPDGRFEIVAGHDRVEAFRRLGKTEIPAVERSMLADDDTRHSAGARDNNLRKVPEKRADVEHVLKAHPDWSDRRIAEQVGAGYTLVASIRTNLVEAGTVPAAGTRTGRDGVPQPATKKPREPKVPKLDKLASLRAAREAQANDNGHKKPSEKGYERGHGLKLEEGDTPERLARRGIQLERETGGTAEDVAKQLGVATKTYTGLKKLVVLADDEGLKEADSARVIEALNAVNEGAGIRPTCESIADIVEAKFGNGGGTNMDRRFEMRLEATERAVLTITTSCVALDAVDVPAGIPSEKRTEWLADLDAAIKSLRNFTTRIKEA